ncbi:MAG: ABC transporter permease [Bacteroidaceae bacterium]|nr:ABC transporter permease [Bacteroidaceae bacterium]
MKNKIGIIIGREFNERVRKKSFIITTLLTPLLIIGLMVAPTLMMTYSGSETKKIAVVDDSGIIAPQLYSNEEVQFEHLQLPIETVRQLPPEAYFAILHICNDIMSNPTAARLYTDTSVGMGLETGICSQIESIIEAEKLKSYNIENIQQILAQIETKVSLQTFKSSADQEKEESATSSIVATVIAYILSFMLYMFLIIYGAMVMQSVIEEKNNRVLEVMVSSVRPFQMMLGKILGVASVAVVQILTWLVIILVAGAFLVPALLPEDITAAIAMMQQGASAGVAAPDADVDLLQALLTLTDIGYIAKIFATLLLFMVGGFLLYAAMFAAVGSSVDNPQDAQQLQLPITLPIILALIIMINVIYDPTSEIAFWFSMIPFTSPIVMMARIPYDIPMWEIIVSLILLYATFAVTVWGAAKIYRVGILMHGKKPTLKELWRWMRYKY